MTRDRRVLGERVRVMPGQQTGRKSVGETGKRIMTGGEAIADMLRLHGARYMFGIGGFQLLPFYDAIARAGNAHPRHILVNDERSGAFAADAYARVSGLPGVCDATLGPGATNLTTGLAESYSAGIPLVAITGDSNREHSGKNMTQEAPQREILAPVVKEVIRIECGSRIPELVGRAFASAVSGRPGPVLVSVPEDVAHGQFEFPSEAFTRGIPCAIPAHRIRPDRQRLRLAADLIRRSQRPVLLAGGGVHLSGAWKALQALVESLGIPVAYTLSGKGAIPCGHPLNLGLFGRYDRIANNLIKESDLLIAVGFKFGEIATVRYSLIPRSVDVIHIDICAEEIGKHQPVRVGLWSDAQSALTDLLEEFDGEAPAERSSRELRRREIEARKQAWLQQNSGVLQTDEKPINMARLCAELSAAVPEGGTLVCDGGFAAHWAGLLYNTSAAGRTFVANRGNASIGYGLPGGIGAQLAAGERPVIALTGDGGFNMSMGDLETAIREGVPLTVVIVNNAASGYVKGLQHLMFNGRYQSSDFHEMNYARIAEAMGCEGIRVEEPGDLGEALRAGVSRRDGPTVVDVVVTRDPARMLPGVDARARGAARAGDRPA